MKMRLNKANKIAPEKTVSIGGISILMVFVMLALTTFGLLTLATARAEMRLTQKNAQSVTAYYDSSARMQELLAQIDGILKTGRQQRRETAEMLDEIETLTGIEVQWEGAGAVLEVRDAQDGPVGMMMRLEIDKDGRMRVAEYHTESTVDFDYEDQRQEIWSGN